MPSFEEVLVIALGAQRVARALSTDEITEPIRARLDEWAERADGTRHAAPARTVAKLIHCPVCTGWWTSLAMSLAWPGSARVRRGVSVAGLQVMFTLAERWVSERGRASIHEADIVKVHSETLAA